MKRLLFLSFFLFVFSGCDPASNETGCSDDSDCRFGRQCVESVCVGEVDITNTNNGNTNNGYTNNGYNNCYNNGSPNYPVTNNYYNNGYCNNIYTNNGYTNNYYSNNGYYTNNGYTSYTNNGYTTYTNNSTSSECRIAQDCGVDLACSKGNCVLPEDAELLGLQGSPDDCSYIWDTERGPAEYECNRRPNSNGFDCSCFVEGSGNVSQTSFRGGQDACDDYDQIEQDMNDFCGTRFRDTFAP